MKKRGFYRGLAVLLVVALLVPNLALAEGAGRAVIKKLAGKIGESLTDRASELLETHVVLSLEDLSEEGSETAGNLLALFYNATDYTINEIYATVVDTLDTVNEIDAEVDLLTMRVEEILQEIEQGFAQNAYNGAAEKLDSVAVRLEPLWDEYVEIAEGADEMLMASGDASLSEADTAALQRQIDELMRRIYTTYGPGHDSFEEDLERLHQAMYSTLGRTTFTDAQMELSRLQYPFEHQIVGEAEAAFSYGGALQANLLWLYSEYANYMLNAEQNGQMPSWAAFRDPQVDYFVQVGNETIDRINTQADASGILDLMQPDQVETELVLANGNSMPAYYVKVNADGRQYMIRRSTIRLGSTVGVTGSSDSSYETYKTNLEEQFVSLDGQWAVPATEAEMKTLFTPTISNPGAWLSNEGGLQLPAHDALALSGLQKKSEKEGHLTIYSYDEPMLDSHRLTVGMDTVWANTCHNLYRNEGEVAWSSRGTSIPWDDTQMLCVYFFKDSSGGTKPDDNGYYAPNDISSMPSQIDLQDGEGLDLRKLGSTDLGGRKIRIHGTGELLGGGRTYQNAEIELSRSKSVLILNEIGIDNEAMGSAAVKIADDPTDDYQEASVPEIQIRGSSILKGAKTIEQDVMNLEIQGMGSGASLRLEGGRDGLFAEKIRFRNLDIQIDGEENGISDGNLYLYDSDMVVSGGTYDLCPQPNPQNLDPIELHLYDSTVDLVHDTIYSAFDRSVSYWLCGNSQLIGWKYPYTLRVDTMAGGASNSAIYFSISGTDATGNPVTTPEMELTGTLWNHDEVQFELEQNLVTVDSITMRLEEEDGYWHPEAIELVCNWAYDENMKKVSFIAPDAYRIVEGTTPVVFTMERKGAG